MLAAQLAFLKIKLENLLTLKWVLCCSYCWIFDISPVCKSKVDKLEACNES